MTPKLLCFHPGAFVTGDPSFEDSAVAFATSLGFQASAPAYPNCDPPGEMMAAINAAVVAGRDGSPVYAYGDSAGASLAARLAQKGRVKAAASYAPVSYLSQWIAAHPALTLIDCLRPYTTREQDSVAPGFHPSVSPIVVFNSPDDHMVDSAGPWAKLDPYVWRIMVTGDHLNGGPNGATPAAYAAVMQRGITFLAKRAGLLTTPTTTSGKSFPYQQTV